jgi:hypothetical protein
MPIPYVLIPTRRSHRYRSALCAFVALLLALLVALPALAQDAPLDPAPADAPPSDPLRDSAIYGWTAPSPEEQLAADDTSVPEGRGAIFVPFLSDASDEPQYGVYRDRRRVLSGSPGRRAILEPGDYVIQLGSRELDELAIPVTVVAGETTVVPVTWGALRVEVTDRNSIPNREGYELIRVSDRDLFGVGYGADLLSGERLQTWILPSDLYRVVQPGSSYRARDNFATVYVPPGGLVRYRLVIDPDDGEFLGAGVITPEETSVPVGDERLTPNLIVGVNGNVLIRDDVVATAELFIDGGLTFADEGHTFASLLQIEEGIRWIDPEVGRAAPVQNATDRVRLDLLYSYELTRVFGPYARAGVETAVFPTRVTTSEDVSVVYTSVDGVEAVRAISAGSSFRTSSFFGQTLFFEGAGINAWALRRDRAQMKLSAGLGFRQGVNTDLYVEGADSTPPTLRYDEVDDFVQQGFEGLLWGRFLMSDLARFTTNLELFSDFREIGDPTVRWENTLSLKLLDVLSLDYIFELLREPEISDEIDLSHEILLRFSWEIL